ncbi:hypothetical protein [Oryza sativa Japonica Group]|uniref:Uncharacterized protein n=1 Tax=Oryza sativa subsp. japonica TaxID=39947 RepID=Q5NA52_ORYSJ|nr:hypothetical protein [Oryza sativa Japonica Group]
MSGWSRVGNGVECVVVVRLVGYIGDGIRRGQLRLGWANGQGRKEMKRMDFDGCSSNGKYSPLQIRH